jgi:hypothetical protein
MNISQAGTGSTASRALAIPEILEAILEHAYALPNSRRALAESRFVNKLWQATTEALLVSTILIAGSEILTYPRSTPAHVVNLTALCEQKPELYRFTREICFFELPSKSRLASQAVTAFSAAAKTVKLSRLMLNYSIFDRWSIWQKHIIPVLAALSRLEIHLSSRALTAAEVGDHCDIISAATSLTDLKLKFGPGHFQHEGNRNGFRLLLESCTQGLKTLQLFISGEQAETCRHMLMECKPYLQHIKSLWLDVQLADGNEINSLLPSGLEQLILRSRPATLIHLLLALEDPDFLPCLSEMPVLLVVGKQASAVEITRDTVNRAIAGLSRRKGIKNLEQEKHHLLNLVGTGSAHGIQAAVE